MITKKFGVDFNSPGGALTLRPSDITDLTTYEPYTLYSKTHDDGWTISGEVSEDYYAWVNDFAASHPIWGYVKGNFESEVEAASEEAFADFYEKHPPEAWDYWDI